MKRFIATSAAALSLFGVYGTPQAQSVERATPWETGDKVTYTGKLGSKEARMEHEVVSSDDVRINIAERVSGRNFDLHVDANTMDISRGMCLSNGQQCLFEPGIHLIDMPLQKGKKWNNDFTVKGETFTAQIKQERVVEKLEKVKVAAGEFEAFRIAAKSRIQGLDKSGNSFAGSESMTEWWALMPSGKAVQIKIEYRNSFGEKANREASAVALK